MDVLISSRNPDKIREIKEILKDLPIKLHTALDIPGLPEVTEDADTLLGNAVKKAKEIAAFTDIAVISDDTGLFIDGLNGEPGVMSARYAGDACTYRDNRMKVLKSLLNIDNRTARFITVAVLVMTDGRYTYAEGCLEGVITDREIGINGFGYDSIFMVEEEKKTLAEMSTAKKNDISHRGRAFRNLSEELRKLPEFDK